MATLSDLPRMVRLAFDFGLETGDAGTLDVTLPDGRTVRLGRNGAGSPRRRMDALRLRPLPRGSSKNSGDIGIAESLSARRTGTPPDLTQFLYLFCVNHGT